MNYIIIDLGKEGFSEIYHRMNNHPLNFLYEFLHGELWLEDIPEYTKWIKLNSSQAWSFNMYYTVQEGNQVRFVSDFSNWEESSSFVKKKNLIEFLTSWFELVKSGCKKRIVYETLEGEIKAAAYTEKLEKFLKSYGSQTFVEKYTPQIN